MVNPPARVLTVLLVEDQPDDAELLLLELRRAGYDPRSRRVDNEPDYLAALAAGYAPGQPWDLILSDYGLPGFSGARALSLLQERGHDLPFILVSGTVGEEFAVQALHGGASDYLLKSRLTRLKSAVSHALEENRLRLETRSAAQALRSSEQRFRALIENSADGIGVVGRDGRLNYMSPASLRLLGFTPEQMVGRNPFEFVHPDDLAQLRLVIRAVLRAPGQPLETAYRLRHASGAWRTIRTSVTNLLAEPSVAGVVFNFRDVTAQQQTDLARRQAEANYRQIFENAVEGIYQSTPAGRYLTANPALARMCGYASPAELMAAVDLNRQFYVDPGRRAEFRRLLEEQESVSDFESEVYSRDGSPLWVSESARAVRDPAGALLYYEGVTINITARRLAEQALRTSEERYRLLFDANPLPLWVYDSERLNFLAVNDAAIQHYGYSRDEFLALTVRDIRPAAELARLEANLRQPRATLEHSGIWQHRRKDGSLIRVEIASHDILFESRPARLVLVNDVTERVQAEAALRASEGRYRGLFEGSPIALLEEDFSAVKQRLDALRQQGQTDIAAYVEAHPDFVIECAGLVKVLDVNPSALKMYGASDAAAFSGELTHIVGARLNTAFQVGLVNVAQGQTDFAVESIEQTLAGEQIHVSLHWSALPGYEQTLERVIVSTIDISERVRAEAELKRRLAELEAVNRVLVTMRSAPTQDEILVRLTRESISALGGAAGSLWLLDEAREQVQVVYEQGWGTRPPPLKLGEGIPGWVVAAGQPVLAADLKTDARLPEDLRADIPAGRGGLCVPLRSADQVIGALYIYIDRPRQLAPNDLNLLTTLAEIAGNAIQRARLHEQTEQQLNRMTALRSVDQAISSSLDLRVTLNVLLDQATTQLAADAADVLLLNAHRQVLEFSAGRGHHGGEAQRLRVRLGEGRAGRAAYERRLVHVADLRTETRPDPAAAMVAAEGYVAYYAVPLLAKGQVKGVLEIYHRRPLEVGQDWLDFLEALASQAAIAIDNATLFDGLQRLNLELTLAYDATIAGWSRALELRDHESAGHTERVTGLAVDLAAALGVPEADQVQLRRGALLHDIGNMGVPTNLLLKPGPLTEDEWVIVRQHPQFAYDLLSPIAYLRPALDIPYNHHERWDGRGYPRHLKGDAIPLAARLFAVVDSWDALLSDRPYRRAWSREQTLAYITEQAGGHFDPRVVGAFLRIVNTPETQAASDED